MKSAFNREVLRSITHSLGRFLAIAAIVALGTGFYAGLRMTAPDMKLAADAFFDNTSLMDVRVLSTYGLTQDDIDALHQVDGVQAVMGAYETDVLVSFSGEQHATRVHSLSESALDSDTSDGRQALSDDQDYLNRPILAEGRWPERTGECVLSADLVVSDVTQLGDTVHIVEHAQQGEEPLATRDYTIVGYVSSSYYATSSSLGSTTLGTGSIQEYMYVPQSDFSADLPFTEAFVTVEGAAAEFASDDAYDQRVQQVVDNIEAMAPAREEARVEGLRSEAQAQLDQQRSDYEREKADALAQLDDAKRQLDEAAATLANSEQTLAAGQAQYDAGVAELANQRAAAEAQLTETAARLDASQVELDANRSQVEQAQQAIGQLDQGIAEVNAQLAPLNDQIAALRAQLEQTTDPTQRAQIEAQIAALSGPQTQLQQTLDGLTQQRAQAQKAVDDFQAGEQQLQQGRQQYEAARAETASQLAAAQANLDAAAAQLSSGRTQLEQGRVTYNQNLAAYEQSRAQADERFADAEHQLAQAQADIDAIEPPEWLIMDRTANYGVSSFESDADRVASIAAVFPFIFFLVAALVALTTMTRMVEEERILIGTFKALGYRRGRIASKYLIYAAIASGAGALLGIGVLSQVLPAVIMQAYAIIYFVPHLVFPLPVDPIIAGTAAGLGVGVTLLATWAAATATLRERPAALMLPRAPKAGKRILLERIAPLWRRLSFSWKVTCRNLFRYKKRLVMTVIGIAGCTALLLTGLGLSDAINDIIDKQYGSITKFNTTVSLDDGADDQQRAAVNEALESENRAGEHTLVYRDTLLSSGPDETDLRVQMIVPEDPATFDTFVDLHERSSQLSVELTPDGLLLTEKLASELGVGIGDTVTLTEQDAIGNATSTSYETPVTGLVENYIYHYVYMGPQRYEQLTGQAPVYNTEFAIASTDSTLRAQLNEQLTELPAVKTVAYNDEDIDTYREMLKSVNMIVVVLVVAAAALAFIVLYNLTNINITERIREIATLKVLGFTPRETSAYIFREIILLSILGCLVGLVLGVWMESFVVVTAEVNQMMFGREIHPLSFVIAFALTMVFTLFVTLAMRHKLARVDMVESLKSNE